MQRSGEKRARAAWGVVQGRAARAGKGYCPKRRSRKRAGTGARQLRHPAIFVAVAGGEGAAAVRTRACVLHKNRWKEPLRGRGGGTAAGREWGRRAKRAHCSDASTAQWGVGWPRALGRVRCGAACWSVDLIDSSQNGAAGAGTPAQPAAGCWGTRRLFPSCTAPCPQYSAATQLLSASPCCGTGGRRGSRAAAGQHSAGLRSLLRQAGWRDAGRHAGRAAVHRAHNQRAAQASTQRTERVPAVVLSAPPAPAWT